MNKTHVVAALVAFLAIGSCSKDKAEDPDPCAYDASQLKYNGFIKRIYYLSQPCS